MTDRTAINGKTRLVCLIGKPIKHSLSPLIHNTGFGALGLNFAYMAFEAKYLKKTVDGFREIGVAGFNVTMPYKQEIIRHLDKVDGQARKIHAVNTVANKGGLFIGYNTDSIGAVRALKKVTKIRGKKILLVGAGGAGRAIAFGLKKEKAELTIAEKSEKKGKALAREVKGKFVRLANIVKTNPDIIINATPVGMEPNINSSVIPKGFLRKGMVVFDIVYDPLETRLLKEAEKSGCRTISGVEMLLEQAFASFEIFTGRKAPESKMRNAVYKELR